MTTHHLGHPDRSHRSTVQLVAAITAYLDQHPEGATVRAIAEACRITPGGVLALTSTAQLAARLQRIPAGGRPAPYEDTYRATSRATAVATTSAVTTWTETPMPRARRTAPAPDAPTRSTPVPTTVPPPVRPPGRGPVVRRDVLLPAALDYAARGWHVFPLRPDDKRPAFPAHTAQQCSPRRPGDARCRAAGTHLGWEQRATTDPDRITRAWQMTTPAGPYGIGIACGPSGLVVLDLDTPKPDAHGVIPDPPPPWTQPGIVDGADVLAVLCESAGTPYPIGSTWTVHTGRGGLHLYFTAPTTAEGQLRCTAGALGWLIDTRAAGGYVVAPPSTVAGRPYVVEDDTAVAAPLPGWLGEALTPTTAPAPGPVSALLRASTHDGDGRESAYLRAAIARQVEQVTTAPQGRRNAALYVSATALGQLVAGGHLEADHVTAVLTDAAARAGLEAAETARTIGSGLRAGARRPRTLTPADHRTDSSTDSSTDSMGAAA